MKLHTTTKTVLTEGKPDFPHSTANLQEIQETEEHVHHHPGM